MFLTFFTELRRARVPVTPREYLDLVRALELDVADQSVEDFYRLARTTLVKDERHLDKFDIVFASVFKGILSLSEAVEAVELPEEWLRRIPAFSIKAGETPVYHAGTVAAVDNVPLVWAVPGG